MYNKLLTKGTVDIYLYNSEILIGIDVVDNRLHCNSSLM